MDPPRSARSEGHLEFPSPPDAAQGLKGFRWVRRAMVRVEVLAYTPTEFIEEQDVTIGRCRELAEKYAVTWVDVIDPDERTLEELEDEIINRPSGEGISRLHTLRADIVRLRNGLRPERDMFALLDRLDLPIFRNETRAYLRDVQDHTINALDTLDANREIIASLMETQATLVSNQMNEVIKVLTVIFTITLPIAIVSSAFGMNVAFFGFNTSEGLYLALLLMGVPTGILAWWMHRKGWL